MSHLVWHSLLRLPAALIDRVLRGDDVRRVEPEETWTVDEDDVLDSLRKWRSG